MEDTQTVPFKNTLPVSVISPVVKVVIPGGMIFKHT